MSAASPAAETGRRLASYLEILPRVPRAGALLLAGGAGALLLPRPPGIQLLWLSALLAGLVATSSA